MMKMSLDGYIADPEVSHEVDTDEGREFAGAPCGSLSVGGR
jgi:hypothetical protein